MGKMLSNPTPFSAINSGANAPVNPTSDSALTVVELFQSQGCSSCPPANANVIDLIENPNPRNLLVLTYEVTYWDHLGWKDTFGNSTFDQRQRDYAKALGVRSVYTPQVIVNGRREGVGSSPRDLRGLLEEGSKGYKPRVSINRTDAGIHVSQLHDPDYGKTEYILFQVLYDPSKLTISITRGENTGRQLPHVNIVRRIIELGMWDGLAPRDFPLQSESESLTEMAVLVQAGRGGPVVGAARL